MAAVVIVEGVFAMNKIRIAIVGENRLDQENIHIGPSDWVAWQKDNKVCFIRMEWNDGILEC